MYGAKALQRFPRVLLPQDCYNCLVFPLAQNPKPGVLLRFTVKSRPVSAVPLLPPSSSLFRMPLFLSVFHYPQHHEAYLCRSKRENTDPPAEPFISSPSGVCKALAKGFYQVSPLTTADVKRATARGGFHTSLADGC